MAGFYYETRPMGWMTPLLKLRGQHIDLNVRPVEAPAAESDQSPYESSRLGVKEPEDGFYVNAPRTFEGSGEVVRAPDLTTTDHLGASASLTCRRQSPGTEWRR